MYIKLRKVYLAVLVTHTQRLALRSDLYNQETLTAMHDKSAAWLGLGAASTAIVNQRKVSSAPGVIAFIAIYLCAGLLFHVNIPGFINIVPFNAIISSTHSTVLSNSTLSSGGNILCALLAFMHCTAPYEHVH